MRKQLKYNYGDRRIKREFLWFPTFAMLDEPLKFRWLKWAWVERKYLAPFWSLVYHWADGPTDFHYAEDRRKAEREVTSES